MIEPTDKDIDAARAAANGEKIFKARVTIGDEEIYAIFKKPSRAEFHRYLDKIGDKDAKTAAITRTQELFVTSCTMWPSASDLKILFSEHYTLATKLSDECFKVAAGDAKATTEGL